MAAEIETGKTVLVVEDVFMVRRTLEMILHRGGYRTVEAPDAHKAMTLLKQGIHVDLITLDIMMPEVDGLQFARVLKKYGPTREIPFVMCSARGEETTVADAMRFGAADFIVKPFTPEVVLEKVDRVLGVNRKALTAKSEKASMIEKENAAREQKVSKAGPRAGKAKAKTKPPKGKKK